MAVEHDLADAGPAVPGSDGSAIAVSVVAPAYNEAPNIEPLVAEIRTALTDAAACRPFEIVLVDDGSDDGTAERIRTLAADEPLVRGVILKRNVGQSAALDAGIDAAQGGIVVPIDADRQHDPADIPRLVARLGDGYDCVSGWRRERQDPLRKRVPSRIQTTLAQWTGPDIHDFGCTLTAYRAAALADLDLRGEGHRYIPARLYAAGHRVTELEVNHRERAAGETKYGVGRLGRGFADLLYHVFLGRWRDRPMHLFGVSGVVLWAVGVALGTGLLAQNYLFGVDLLPNLPQLILAVALTLFGFGLLAFGVIVEVLTDLRYRDSEPYRVAEYVE
jgi:glycosyltransferase involved in cell wall biosynthesis